MIDEVQKIAVLHFDGNKSGAMRRVVGLGLKAWELGARHPSQVARISSEQWCIDIKAAFEREFPDADLVEVRPFAGMPGDQDDIHTIVLALGANRYHFSAVSGVDPDSLAKHYKESIDS